jgi:predicted nucleic acid-binding Zn ribbon protein
MPDLPEEQTMPSFDFHCAANGQTLEVMLKMHEEIHTWGELCARKGLPLGDTPADAPIEKVFTSAVVMDKKRMGSGHASVDMSFSGRPQMVSADPR